VFGLEAAAKERWLTTNKRNRIPVRSGVVWITGIPASGKTTTGKTLYEALRAEGVEDVVWLDGEQVREMLKDRFGFSSDEREKVAEQVVRLVREYNEQGKVVIVSTISHRIETRRWIRARLGRFLEVYLKCPVEVCAERDYKDNYRKAFAGKFDNFPGVTEPYEESDPELVLCTATHSVAECGEALLRRVREFITPPADVAAASDSAAAARQSRCAP
jgi:adenylylsulfate kinase-like enzyme